MCANKKCQATKCYKKVNKTCQTSDMWPVKLQMDMWSKEPAMQSSFKKKHVPLCKDKNCLSPKFIKYMCSDKTCQENIIMQPEMPERDMWLPKPAVL